MNYLDVAELTHVTGDSQKNAINFKNATKDIDVPNSGIIQLNHLRTTISWLRLIDLLNSFFINYFSFR